MTDPFFVVTSTGKGCDPLPCIDSVARQSYPYFRHFYIAADSPTYNKAARAPVGKAPTVDCRRRTVIENVYTYWQTLRDDDVVVWLDGDDWLAHPRVLEHLADLYFDRAPWLTYGSFRFSTNPGFRVEHLGTRYPYHADVRGDVWRASHLKTFRAGLVKRVSVEHLKRHVVGCSDGRVCLCPFVEYCTDRVFMLPMLEMAGERYEVVSEVLSVYNWEASFSFNNRDPAKTAAEEAERARIHAMARYELLEERPW